MFGDEERDRKRKTSEYQSEEAYKPKQFRHEYLSLSLSLSPPRQPSPPSNLHLLPLTLGRGRSKFAIGAHIESGPRRNTCRNPTQAQHGCRDDSIPAPFLWATNHRATIQSLDFLISSGIHTISGELQCKKCEFRDEIKYDLLTKFREIANFIYRRKSTMHDRAPAEWMNPTLPDCRLCQQKECMKPVISLKKRLINWLFLLLGQMLGCCTLEQLKYFCKHTKNHRTGAKDRVLYLTYLSLCKQLDSAGNFDP